MTNGLSISGLSMFTMEKSKDNLSKHYDSRTDRVFTPVDELRADAAMTDELQKQFHDVDEVRANRENYDDWPTDPKKRVVGKKYIYKGKIVECCHGNRGPYAKSTIEQIVIEGDRKHNGKYNYPIQEYANKATKIRIYCPECNQYFHQNPDKHIRENGCMECGKKIAQQKRRATTEEFIEKAKEAQGKNFNKYGYDKVIYQNSKMDVEIFCKICNKYFLQMPANHLKGRGCMECGKKITQQKRRSTTDEFIEKAKEAQGVNFNNYEYSDVEYKNRKTPVIITCKICKNQFKQTPNNHLSGYGCQACGRKKCDLARRLTNDEFIKRVKKGQGICFHDYDYSAAEYIRNDIPVKIFCKKCELYFLQTPDSHIHGRGCIFCKNKTERKLLNFLTSEYPDKVEYQKDYDWCRSPETGYPYWFDYIVNENIIIELDGDQHIKQVRNWKCPEEQQERDMYKMEQAINNGKHVIRILQRDVWNDTNDWKEKLIQAITELKDITDPTIRCIGDCAV